MFIKYPKIHRLGKEETEGILLGKCYIQEKIDGANTSIWMEDGQIKCASRNNELSGGFNGFVEYVSNHSGIKSLFESNPSYRLYGEWLVRHTIGYNETSYNHFYLFDVFIDGGYEGDRVTGTFLDIDSVNALAEQYGIRRPQLFDTIENPSEEYLKSLAGKSDLGEKGEGVVIKNLDFKNKFGVCEYAKIVTQTFKEDNAITFGGNNKHSDTYWEMYVVNKYMTLPRIKKIMHKLEPVIDERLDMKHIPRITHTAYHDMLTEEIWEIAKKAHAINFKSLQSLSMRKARQIYVDVLNNSISVADQVKV